MPYLHVSSYKNVKTNFTFAPCLSGINLIMQTSGFHIKGFDGLRALSILLVLFTHLGWYDALPDNYFFNALEQSITGMVGVTMFFTISGFLITTLLLREKAKNGTINYKHFIVRRFLRLLPVLVLFYFTMCILILTHQLNISWVAFFISVFYGYNFVPNRLYFSELGHTWSLAVEEQFYILWPWVVLFFKKNGLLLVALFMLALAILALIVLPTYRITFNGKSYFIGESFHANRFFLPAIAPIMIGSIAAALHFFYPEKLIAFCSSMVNKLLIVITMLAAFWLPDSLQTALFLIHALCFAWVLGYIHSKQQSLITTILEWRPLAFTGKISYGIYVWQGLFLGTGPGGKLWIQQPIQNLLLTWLVAIACYYLVEVKVLRLKKHFIA